MSLAYMFFNKKIMKNSKNIKIVLKLFTRQEVRLEP